MAAGGRQLREIRRRVLAWYAVERRDFPWRRTRDPWAVLVSEVMLQQTQASRVVERFPLFLRRFPTAAAMADASEAEVLVAWAGLGYNRRALSLRAVAAVVRRDGWPSDADGLRGLPGIGPYTSRAVAALAFGHPVGAVDTNVRRWLTRRFGLEIPAAASVLQDLADGLATAAVDLPSDVAAAWMHASMEFGARVCSARAPDCRSCPIARGCPSRNRAVAVPGRPQPAFGGSDRALRGALLRALTTSPERRVTLRAARALAAPRADAVLAGLERDRLAHRSGRHLKLGGQAGDAPPTTIGP
ncbi:MAG TPA: A/G-specific adenine glycosylase [Candidatus Limnocylindria bacterium]|nr:A/G-specific adenine glycosylase [Candidatus Limnocylindria bacterium]